MLSGSVTVSGEGHFCQNSDIRGKISGTFLASNIAQAAVISGWNGPYESMTPRGHVRHLAAVIGDMSGAQWVQNSRQREVRFGLKYPHV